MATDPGFVDELQDQSGLGRALVCKKMFGEYALYLHGKVIALVCDNQLYVKPTDAGRLLLGTTCEAAPYPGARPHFRIDEPTEDRERLRRLFEVTATALPLPKPKPKRAPKVASRTPSKSASKSSFETTAKTSPDATGAKPAAKPSAKPKRRAA